MRFKLFLIGLFALLAVNSLLGSDTYIDERENWDAIIQNFNASFSTYRQLSKEVQAFINTGLAKFDHDCDRIQKRGNELDFLLNGQENDDVFGIALYCRQITDLKTAFDYKVNRLTEYCDRLKGDLSRARLMESGLQKLNRKDLNTSNLSQLNTCKEEMAFHIRILQSSYDRLNQRLIQALKLKAVIDELNKTATERRKNAMDKIIFSRYNTVFQIIPLIGVSFKVWLSDVACWMAVQFPDDPIFWRNLILLILFGGLPLFLCNGLLYRRIMARVDFPEKYAKRYLFMGIWALMIVAVICLLTSFMLGDVESAPFIRAGQFLLALSGLMLALSVRLERNKFIRCMWLYLPMIIQHLAGILLCTLLIPYQPLLVLVPLLNLPVIVATLWMLLRFEYPLADRAFGVLTVLFAIGTMMMALVGLAYVAFTMMLVWFVIVAGIQAGMALSILINQYCSANSQHKIMACMMLTLFVPVMWLGIIGGIIYWTAGLYNAQELFRQMIVTNFISYKDGIELSLMDILIAVLGILVMQFLLSTIKHITQMIFGNREDMGLIPTFMTLGTYLAWCLYIIFVLVIFNVHYSSILVVLGGMSMGVGFGMKEIVENFISGIILLAGKQLRPGDQIEFNGIWGRVRKVSVRATVVDTDDNSVITFPNSQVLSKDFRNWTLNRSIMRREIKVGVAYGSDITKVMSLLQEIVHDEQNVYKNPHPDIYFSDFGDSALLFTIRVWMSVNNRHVVPSNLRVAINEAFAQNGIVIAFPQLDVHFDSPTVIPEIQNASVR